MTVGVPCETKAGERRVGLVPADVALLTPKVDVIVESGAGSASGFSDAEFARAGATVADRKTAWDADLVVKVKELQPAEEERLHAGQTLFCYTHLFDRPDLVSTLRDRGVSAIDFQTVEDARGRTPLLEPMSRIAGRLASLIAAELLFSPPGRGVLVGGPGDPVSFLVLGFGAAGQEAHACATQLGAEAFVLASRGRHERGVLVEEATPDRIRELLPEVDVVVGTAFRPGQPSPVLIGREDLGLLRTGSVIVDVAIDGGGCVETSRETSLRDPWFLEAGVVHYAVPNMPALVPVTGSVALSRAVLPYVEELATDLDRALEQDAGLRAGLQIRSGKVLAAGLRAS